MGSGEGSLSQTRSNCLAAAVAKFARSLGREGGCPGPWTLGCAVPMHSQALCVWGELNPPAEVTWDGEEAAELS